MGAAGSSGPDFALLYGCLFAVATVAALVLRAGLQRPDDAPDPFAPALHPIEIAYLAGGVLSALESAVALVRHRVLARGDEWNESADHLEALPGVLTHDVSPVERAIYTLVAKHGGAVERARREAGAVLRPVRLRLTWLKLLAPEPSVRRARSLQLLLFGALLALGVARVAGVGIGGAAGRPSDFFVFWLWIAAAWLMTRVRPRPPCRSRRGDRLLEQLRAKHIALLWKLREQPHRLPANDFALAVALFGAPAGGQAYAAIGRVGARRTPSGVADDYFPDPEVPDTGFPDIGSNE
jgi:uncharacterized protein (TIGR04222 family)